MWRVKLLSQQVALGAFLLMESMPVVYIHRDVSTLVDFFCWVLQLTKLLSKPQLVGKNLFFTTTRPSCRANSVALYSSLRNNLQPPVTTDTIFD